jgi:hypothetical protein
MPNRRPAYFLNLVSLGAAGAAGYIFIIRPWLLRWGASAQEVHQALPGDDLVPNPRIESTHAITIQAPPERVFSWLKQIGQDRAGFYSYDFLENWLGLGIHSASRIVDEYQNLAVGDQVKIAPESGMRVEQLDPPSVLALGAQIDPRSGRTAALDAPATSDNFYCSWVFVLQPRAQAATRLLARFRCNYLPTSFNSGFARAMLEPAMTMMDRKMLLGIRQRSEG